MDKLVEKCEEDIVYSATLYDYGFNRKVCKSCMWFAILLIIEFVLIISVVCWTPSSSLNGPIKQGLSVLLSVLPSVQVFLGIVSLVYSEFWHGARNPFEVVHDRARLSGKNCFASELENGPKMCQKQGFLNLLKNLVIDFY